LKNIYRHRVLSIAQQRQKMSFLHPQFEVRRFERHRIVWQGNVQPTNASETYTLKIIYNLDKSPEIQIVSPKIQLVGAAKKPPHTFKDKSLCLYYSKHSEWESDDYIADTIVPWISLWLFYYEGWVATGEWHGGGIEHNN